MKAKLFVSSPDRKLRQRALACALALAVIVAALKLSPSAWALMLGAGVGATMLTTALTANRPPATGSPIWSKAAYVLTFALIDTLAALDELARFPRL